MTHSWFIGTERLLIALIEQPEWCMDMFNTFLDLNLKLFDRIWDAGYRFDGIRWPDDMGFKHSQIFSLNIYKELLKPVHKSAVEWAHKKGVKALLHSCGNIKPLIPEFIDFRLDGLNPLEVKAGMEKTLPVMMENGGYIFSSDHSVPSSISLEEYKEIAALAKKIGRY